MKLKDLQDDFTRQQFMQLDKESLDQVPYTRVRWLCQCKGCKNGTHVRDYGLGPFNPKGIWAFIDRNSKNAKKNPQEYWIGPNNYWLCSKHNRLYKRLIKRFDIEHVWKRLLDSDKDVFIQIDEKNMAPVQRVEKNYSAK